MEDGENANPLRFPVGALKRPRYQAGHYLAASDLATWQHYRLQRLRRHRRYLHGWGVVCGLRVVPAAEPERPWAVRVCPGYAIGPYGDEIEVGGQVVVDLREYTWLQTQALSKVPEFPTAVLALRYVEQMGSPRSSDFPSCGCEEPEEKPSRIRDGFRIDVLWQAPLPVPEEEFDVCEEKSAPCPDCPESPYIYLACINLPEDESQPIRSEDIDNWSCRPPP